MRAMTRNPTIQEFERNFDKTANELNKQLHANELGYNIKITNTKKHHYAKSVINGNNTKNVKCHKKSELELL